MFGLIVRAFETVAMAILPALQLIENIRGHVEGDHAQNPEQSCWACR